MLTEHSSLVVGVPGQNGICLRMSTRLATSTLLVNVFQKLELGLAQQISEQAVNLKKIPNAELYVVSNSPSTKPAVVKNERGVSRDVCK